MWDKLFPPIEFFTFLILFQVRFTSIRDILRYFTLSYSTTSYPYFTLLYEIWLLVSSITDSGTFCSPVRVLLDSSFVRSMSLSYRFQDSVRRCYTCSPQRSTSVSVLPTLRFVTGESAEGSGHSGTNCSNLKSDPCYSLVSFSKVGPDPTIVTSTFLHLVKPNIKLFVVILNDVSISPEFYQRTKLHLFVKPNATVNDLLLLPLHNVTIHNLNITKDMKDHHYGSSINSHAYFESTLEWLFLLDLSPSWVWRVEKECSSETKRKQINQIMHVL